MIMTNCKLVSTGVVTSLAVNGKETQKIEMLCNSRHNGPKGDVHASVARELRGHDGDFRKFFGVRKGYPATNWRGWTAISLEEIISIAEDLALPEIPPGCLLENITISGIPNFSSIPRFSWLVFPEHKPAERTILLVWSKNEPCEGVGRKLQDLYKEEPKLSSRFIKTAMTTFHDKVTKLLEDRPGRRGLMGSVVCPGPIHAGDSVEVYSWRDSSW